MAIKCTSCHKNLLSEDNFTRFACPSCSEVEIVRCESCRRKGNKYRCRCGFEGP